MADNLRTGLPTVARAPVGKRERSLVRKGGLALEDRGAYRRRSRDGARLKRHERARAAGESSGAKGGLEPPRYCYRQPLKLADLQRRCELMRILQTDPGRR